ncbi:DinB family protein [Roseivirga misakiensis]|uniref:DinB-like domain-containing protein n=1 Tax=Roseivirga misakiensis TaxID=1563681 RepID=A0A1E5T372_9BACT|nr:DinB family protein [Roseivirga misakiensis]OEK05838.1 hypothetical protein BFP71_06890 [Roseivirga misakiensis]
MVITSKEHISNSKKGVDNLLYEVRSLLEDVDERSLNMPENINKWSILQCLKHMSFAIEVYNKNIKEALDSGRHKVPAPNFKSHWKGDMFTKMISPKPNGEVSRPMRTFSSMNPVQILNPEIVVNEFFTLYEEFGALIERSAEYNLNSIKINTALGPLVKLRLGDAYRFVIGHAERHLVQLKRIKASLNQVAA